jgi:hypothetical protein
VRPITVADKKTLQNFTNAVLDNLTEISEMAVPKANSSCRYVLVYRMMVVFYHMKGTGAGIVIDLLRLG